MTMGTTPEKPHDAIKDARGAVLRLWRANDPLEQVAVVAGVTRQTVWNWEQGRGEPGVECLKAMEKWRPGLLRALGLAPKEAG
jgi:transcriptional regulator with XRE-family HTH domain